MRQCRGVPYSTVKICAGQDAHGCVQLIMNRRVTVSFVNRSATSGRAFLRALVSILEEVTAPMYSVLPSLDALRIAHSGLYGGLNCLRFCLCVLN